MYSRIELSRALEAIMFFTTRGAVFNVITDGVRDGDQCPPFPPKRGLSLTFTRARTTIWMKYYLRRFIAYETSSAVHKTKKAPNDFSVAYAYPAPLYLARSNYDSVVQSPSCSARLCETPSAMDQLSVPCQNHQQRCALYSGGHFA